MKNMVMFKKGENAWVTYIRNRVKSNLNFIAIAEGSTGVGKSWAMLSVGYQIDPDFTIDQVAFSFKEVMQILNADWFKTKKGFRVIVFDEPQTDISNRAWQSLTNRLMNYLTSTFRHQNIILLMATPYADFIDSQTQKLIHCKFVVKGHSRHTNLTTIRPKLQQYNSQMKKYYNHSLMVSSKKGTFKMTQWKIIKPPKHLIDPYEEKKTAFTSGLNKDILEQLEVIEKKNKPPVEDMEKPSKIHRLEGEDKERYEYLKEHPNLLKQDYAKAFGIKPQQMAGWIKKMDKIEVNTSKYIGKHDYLANLGLK